MSGITASLRFDGDLNKSMRRIGMNLTSFPRLHFLSVNVAPLVAQRENFKNVKLSVDDLTNSMWNVQNFLNGFDGGRYLATTSVYRGEFKEEIADYTKMDEKDFVN